MVSDWKTYKLNELGELGRGKSRHRPRNDPTLYGGVYPFFQTGDIKEANLYLREYSQTYNEKGLEQSKLWETGTLCITIAANIAETAILAVKGCFPDSIIGFIPYPDKSDVRFIKYYIDNLKAKMQNISMGTTQDNLSVEKILTFDFEVPSVNKQKELADILSNYDLFIENNTRRVQILEEMAQDIYKEWFVNFSFPGHEKIKLIDSKTDFGKIPEGWRVYQVEDLVERVSPGKLYDNKSALKKGLVPILDQGKSGIIGYHNDEPGVEASMEKPIIVFANHTCYQRLIHFSFSAIQNVLPFCPSEENYRNIYWLHSATKDVISLNDYKGHWPEFMAKKIIVPTEEIAQAFGDTVKPLVLLAYKLELANVSLRQSRDLLIPKLVTGEIRV